MTVNSATALLKDWRIGGAANPSGEAGQGHAAPAVPSLADIAIRIIGLRDRNHLARSTWLREWMPLADARLFDRNDSQVLSQAQSSFDVLVLHGDDTARMARIIKEWRSVLSSKLIVAVAASLDSQVRANLLNAGADAALDLSTEQAVAGAWVHSLVARKGQLRQAPRPQQEIIDDVCLRSRATRLQRKLITLLIGQVGLILPYADMLDELGKPNAPQHVRSLHVAMCNFKKKLPAEIKITNVQGVGYKASIS